MNKEESFEIIEWLLATFPNSAYFWIVGFYILFGLMYTIFICFNTNKNTNDFINEHYIKTKKSNLIITLMVVLILIILGYFLIPFVTEWIWNFGQHPRS